MLMLLMSMLIIIQIMLMLLNANTYNNWNNAYTTNVNAYNVSTNTIANASTTNTNSYVNNIPNANAATNTIVNYTSNLIHPIVYAYLYWCCKCYINIYDIFITNELNLSLKIIVIYIIILFFTRYSLSYF